MLLVRFFSQIIILLMYCSLVFSKHNDDSMIQNSRYTIGFDLGVSTTQDLGNSVSFPLGYSTFIYNAKNTTASPLRLGISARKNINLSSLDALQIGFSYHYIANMGVRGSLEQGISPPYSAFTYSYKINGSQLLAEAKILHQLHKVFYPYVIGGVGAGFNRAQNYSTNIPDYLTITPHYENKSTSSFSYTVGCGVDLLASESFALGLGYRFSDLGRINLGNGHIRNTTITSQLMQSHLYLNSLLVELNWFF